MGYKTTLLPPTPHLTVIEMKNEASLHYCDCLRLHACNCPGSLTYRDSFLLILEMPFLTLRPVLLAPLRTLRSTLVRRLGLRLVRFFMKPNDIPSGQ